MDAQEAAKTSLYSASGTIRELGYNVNGEVEYIGLADFRAPFDEKYWLVTKFTWSDVAGKRCVTRIEDNTLRNKWTDRTNAAIMGWR